MDQELSLIPLNLEEEFMKVMRDEKLCGAFREFMKESHSNENLTFWLEVENFKNLPQDNIALITEEAMRIYLLYFKRDSRYELNVTSKEKQELEESLKHPTFNMFDQVQSSIFSLMAMDCYPKFVRSEIYQQIVAEQNSRTDKFSKGFSRSATSKKPMGGNSLKFKDAHNLEEWKQKHSSTFAFDEYFKYLEKISNKSPDQKITAHIHIVTERSVWKVFEFEPNVTVDEAIKQIGRKIHIAEETIHNYCLCVPTDTSVQEVLDNYRRLSSYDVIKHDVLIFKMRPHLGAMKFDKANALGEIKIINLKGEEQRIHVNFEDSFAKIFSFICNKNGYKKKTDLCIVSLENQKEVEQDKSLKEQNITPNTTMVVKKKSKKQMKDKGSAESLATIRNSIEKANAKSTKLFGASLKQAILREDSVNATIPAIVEQTIGWLITRGLDTEGLFEKEGDKVAVESYKHALDHSGEIDLDTCRNPHTICNLLKLYLQSLPEPLLTFENYTGFLNLPNELFDPQATQTMMDKLPPENRAIVNRLLLFLDLLVEHSAQNKLTLEKLAAIFAPIFLRPSADSPKASISQETFNAMMVLQKYARTLAIDSKGSSADTNIRFLYQLRALYNYDAKNPDELSFKTADMIWVVAEGTGVEGWWKGYFNGKTGMFPVNYFAKIQASQPIEKSSSKFPSLRRKPLEKIASSRSQDFAIANPTPAPILTPTVAPVSNPNQNLEKAQSVQSFSKAKRRSLSIEEGNRGTDKGGDGSNQKIPVFGSHRVQPPQVDSPPTPLAEMFPNIPRSRILEVLNRVSGDFNKAVDILSAESNSNTSTKTDVPNPEPSTAPHPPPTSHTVVTVASNVKQETPQSEKKQQASIRNRSRSRSQPDIPNQYSLFSDKIVIESVFKDLNQLSTLLGDISLEDEKKKQATDSIMFIKSKVMFMKEKIEKLQEQKDELRKQLQVAQKLQNQENP